MKGKIKKIVATVACMALACVSFVGCAGEPEWWTKVKDWFNGETETSTPVEDESGEEDEGAGEEGPDDEGTGDETSTPEEEESSTPTTEE